MVKEIKMPDISEDADSGTVVEILVQEGDTIEEEQSIIAVESDKASVEVPCPEGGTVKEIKIAEGDELKVGDVILTLEIGEDGESEEEDEGEAEEKPKEKAKKEAPEDEEAEETEEEKEASEEKEEVKAKKEPEEGEKKEKKKAEKEDAEEEDEEEAADQKTATKKKETAQDEESKEEVPAAPSVRRLSRELGVDIYQVKGSGPGGRITADDVKAQAEGGQKERPAKSKEKALPDFSQWGDVEREKMSSIRRITAESMSDAWQTVPHVTQFDKADITQLEEYTAQYQQKVEKAGGKLTITAILLKVSAGALRAFPKFNASLDVANEEVIYKKYYHIGVAVDTEKGLLVPVIRDVDKKSVVKLSAELPEIAEKARDGKLSSEDMKGGSFTVSNLGGIGGTQFTPIVYKPQVAILGISRTQMEPVYIDGEFQPRSMLPLSLSYDHRLIDGAEAARFLRWICQALEDPFVMLMEG